MSEEVLSADALLTENAELHARVKAMSLQIGVQNTTIGYQDAMLNAAAADAAAARELEPTRIALHNAWKLIGRIDMALETLPNRPSLRTIQLTVKQLRAEIKKASEPSWKEQSK